MMKGRKKEFLKSQTEYSNVNCFFLSEFSKGFKGKIQHFGEKKSS